MVHCVGLSHSNMWQSSRCKITFQAPASAGIKEGELAKAAFCSRFKRWIFSTARSPTPASPDLKYDLRVMITGKTDITVTTHRHVFGFVTPEWWLLGIAWSFWSVKKA